MKDILNRISLGGTGLSISAGYGYMRNTAGLQTLSIVSKLKYEIIRGTFEVQPTGQATKASLFVPGGALLTYAELERGIP
jgi:hypothetical protein